MIAATGAKNGASCPSTHLAITQAAATAIAACTGMRQFVRTRCQRVAIDTRERLAASSNSPSGITAPRRYSTRSSPSSGSGNARPACSQPSRS